MVIGLQTTGEAAADALGLAPGQACGSVSPTREMLGRFIEAHFPVLRETAKSAGARARMLHGRASAASLEQPAGRLAVFEQPAVPPGR